VHCLSCLERCIEFITPTKFTVLNTHKSNILRSDMLCHKCPKFSKHNMRVTKQTANNNLYKLHNFPYITCPGRTNTSPLHKNHILKFVRDTLTPGVETIKHFTFEALFIPVDTSSAVIFLCFCF
jgi:hypothetical protein